MVAIILRATTLPSRDACCAVGGQYLPVAGSGTSAQSPSAQRPSTPSTFKFELTLTRPRSFSHGTRSRIGFGDMPAVQTSVELTIFSPLLSSISFGRTARDFGLRANLHSALTEFFI